VFNPVNVGSLSPVPATQVLGYPLANLPPTTIFVNSDTIRGLAVPAGSRSALFIGRHGTGASCYGTGDACGDPTDQYKGYHAYPYQHQVWAYDLLDLAAVKNGSKQPWDLRPYAMWTLDLPFSQDTHMIEGAAFDPASGRLFVVAANSDGPRPIIHVFTVGSGGTSHTSPNPPSNLRIIPGL
jgi:hypothetical protein